MRRLHGIAVGSLTALLLSSALTPTANAAPQLPSPPSSCPIDGMVAKGGTTITTDGTVQQRYFQDDLRLGPKDLPSSGPAAPLLAHYQRFQAMGPNKLIDCYWKVNVKDPDGKVVTGWAYPPNDGFATRNDNQTVHAVTPAGRTKLQLFGGSPTSRFFAPSGTLFEQSAIPPSNLDTFTDKYPFNYHLYLVCQDFTADEGTTAPWFQQPGGGTQYFSHDTLSQLTSSNTLKDITYTPATC